MSPIHISYKIARRIAIAIVGGTILMLGLIMLVTPGPAVVFIPVGLAVLGLEFAWARAWLKRLRHAISNNNARRRNGRSAGHAEGNREP